MGGYNNRPRDDDDDDERYRDVDDDDDDLDDEEDDDISSRLGNRPRPNPFTSSGSGFSSGTGQRSGLPGASSGSSSYSSRFGESSSSGSSGGGLSSRLGASGGSPSGGSGSPSNPSGGSRFGSSGSSGSSGTSGSSGPFNRPSSPSGGSGSSSSRDTGEQPATSRFGGSGSSGSSGTSGSSSPFNRPSSPSGGSGSSGSSGSSQFGGNRPSSPSSPIRGGESNPPGGGSGSSINRTDLGSRLGTSGSSPSGSSGGFGSPRSPSPSDSEKKDASGRPSTPSKQESKPGSSKPGDKKDAPASGGGGFGSRLGNLTGGITSRIGGGDDKKDDKKPGDKKDAPAEGGIGARLGNLTGGITSRFGGGDDKKPGDKKDAPAEGGIGARLGGFTSGLTSRFGGGEKKDDKKPTTTTGTPPRSSSPSSSSSSSGGLGASRFGGGSSPSTSTSSSARPSSPSSSLSGSGSKQSPLGGAKATAQSTTKADAGKSGGGLAARFSSFTQNLPFIGKGDGKSGAKKQRASKVPAVKSSEGMSLDTKLDILGVVCVFASLIIFFGALSSNQGQITGWINQQLGQVFGWGALAAPFTLLAIGVWLILRHFGDKAPEIDPVRVIGVVMLYVGLLVIFQFVESLNYTGARAVVTLGDLATQVQVSWQVLHTGGGWVGGQIYLFLVSNITEVGAFFTVVGWMFIGFMLFADLSASEVAIVIISLWRSFSDSVKRQRQRRSARIAELQTQRAAAAAAAALAAPQQPQIAVSKPAAAELPAAVPAAALPAPTATPVAMPVPAVSQTEERSIPMRLGGRSEVLKVDNAGRTVAPAPGQPVQPAASVATPEKSAEGESGGIGSRLRGALPFGGKSASETPAAQSTAPADKPAAASSLAGRLFGGKSAESTADKPPASTTPAADKPAAASSLAGRLFGGNKPADKPQPAAATPTPASTPTSPSARPAAPAPTVASTPPAPQSPSVETPAARLGDLLRTPSTPSVDKPATPMGSTSAEPRTTSGLSAFSRPPSSTVPLPRPLDDEDEDEMDEDDESVMDMSPARPKGVGPAPRPPSPFGVNPSPVGQKPAESETVKPAGGVADRMDRLNALRSGTTAPPVPPVPRPTDDDKSVETAAKVEPSVAETAKSDDSAQGGVAARIRPFNFGEQSDKPATTVGASVVSSAPKDGDEKKPPVFTPAGTPAVTAAPKISIPIGHPDTPPAPAPVAPAATLAGAAQIRRPKRDWNLPDYRTLLATGSDQDFDREFLTQRAHVIEETLQSFGAPGKVVEINTGPVITQFGVEPDYLMSRSGKKNRIKVSAIAALDKDLQLALGAKSIRIEAPVPGKGYVGVEVPNDEAALVSLRDVMDSDEFKKIDSPLTIALGQSVDGTPVAADLSSMPHLLIAGTTGSGKSVCVNAIISSIVLLNSPDRVKFIMVDPKRVELTGYNGIPHLVAPVVVELERIVGVLKWVTREMDERYKKFSAAGARNIEDYNKHLPADAEIMPYIVVIIDELADLMMLAPDETERVITRIAALARATGIHLVIATQRPSVDVVTGLIKANFPARIAFAVAGSVDSRVILDQPGAERLLGRGDMLYMSGDSPAPVRLQGVYVSDIEINNIVRYWKQHGDEGGGMPVPQLILDKSLASEPSSPTRSTGTMPQQAPKPVAQQQAFWDRSGSSARDEDDDGYDDDVEDADGDGEDDMYDEAVELIRKLNKASVSLLQRRLRIGYTRAARLIDLMEERGVVGPAESGSKPRDVLPAKD